MKKIDKKVEMARMVQPRFLSLVGLPANQVAFKIIRDDNGEQIMSAPHITRKRTTRRSDKLVSIEFGADVSDDEIKQTMDEWGISGYSIESEGEKKIVNTGDAGDRPTMRVRLGDKAVAVILQPISNTVSRGEKKSIAVVRMEFAADYFPSTEDVLAWCRDNGVDLSKGAIQNAEQHISVSRGVEVGEDEEIRVMQVDPGVQFAIARAESQDIPEEFITVVSDAAYSGWGWGMLDFSAAIADSQFGDISREAIYVLDEVIRNILYYSELPVGVRKELLVSATEQFSAFIGGLLDALPAKVVVANRSTHEKGTSMSKVTEESKSKEGAGVSSAAASGENSSEATESISRSEVEELVKNAVAGLSTQLAELTARIDVGSSGTGEGESTSGASVTSREDGEGGEGEGADGKKSESGESMLEVLRSVKDLAESFKAVSERVVSLEGYTSVRSDSGDAKQKARADVFKGVFGGSKT